MTYPTSSPTTTKKTDRRLIAKMIYLLYLISLVTCITALIGVVMGYVYRGQANDDIEQHLRFQRRTFWIGLVYFIIAGVLTLVIVGYILLFLVYIWIIIRCTRGWRALEQGKPPERLENWLY